MKITVIGGAGYVGLTTSVCLAVRGNTVYCVDKNVQRIRCLRTGKPTIYEESLDELIRDTLNKGTFIPSMNCKDAVRHSQVIFICVGTPSQHDGSIDLSQVEGASKEIGLALSKDGEYKVIVVKSTVVPGTTEELVIPKIEEFSNKKAGIHFGVCTNPEFLREGRAVKDFLFPKEAGIIIGELDEKSGNTLQSIYKEFDAEIVRTSIKAAEMIKYTRNSYLAKDISFANEIANICQKFGIDYLEVKKGTEMDARIGKGRFLDAGAGFGGSCFPKDVKSLIAKAKKMGVRTRILDSTLQVNCAQPHMLVRLTAQVLGKLKDKKIAVLGLAFKSDTDDMREAPSIEIVNSLLLKGAEIFAYDPQAMENARKIFGNRLSYSRTATEALKNADACIIVTEWPQFGDPKLYQNMKSKIIVDGRRVLDPNKLEHGFLYQAIGFPGVLKT